MIQPCEMSGQKQWQKSSANYPRDTTAQWALKQSFSGHTMRSRESPKIGQSLTHHRWKSHRLPCRRANQAHRGSHNIKNLMEQCAQHTEGTICLRQHRKFLPCNTHETLRVHAHQSGTNPQWFHATIQIIQQGIQRVRVLWNPLRNVWVTTNRQNSKWLAKSTSSKTWLSQGHIKQDQYNSPW